MSTEGKDPAGVAEEHLTDTAAPAVTAPRMPRKTRSPAGRKALPAKAAAAGAEAAEPQRYPTIGDALNAQYKRYLQETYPLGPPPAIPGAPPAWLTEADRATSKDPWLATVKQDIDKALAGFDDGIKKAWQDIAEIHRRYQPALVAEPAFDEALAWGPGNA